MHIKAQTVLPAGTKVTKCPPAEGKAKSIWVLDRAHEKQLERQAELKSKAEKFTQLIKSGHTVTEALKLCS